MIRKLIYFVTFHINGKAVDYKNSIDFELGMTAITGRNGKGKSLTIEMAQFAWFGVKALRGKSEDYKNLAVDAVFDVKSKTYRVERTIKNATLYCGDTPIATGTTPVNQEIAALFGYSYDVFQVANVANQGSIERLGNMKPTERKQLVDETIGLNVLDDLDKYIAGELKELSGKISGMESAIVVPTEPSAPDNYAPSASLASDLETLRNINIEKQFLEREAFRTLTTVFWPKAPADVDLSKLGEFEANQLTRQTLATELSVLQREAAKIPEAHYTIEELLSWKHDWEAIGEKANALAQKAQWEKTKVRHECPKCQHEWFDQDPRLIDFVIPEAPEVSPPVPYKTVIEEMKAVPQQERKQQLLQEIAQVQERFNGLPDYANEIALIKQYNKDLEKAQRDQETYDKAKVAIDGAKEALKLEKYLDIETRLAVTEVQYRAAISYEALVSAYEKQKETYDRLVCELAQKKEEKSSWEAAKKAVVSLRAKVKGYLLPSLNAVASNLIHQMTGGELDWIVVNEDFEITVAGQRLDTLSGSGKAVANLALRIALGQVLTNKVFSVMMLDEIDASCDDIRAQYIAECVRRLNTTIQQVVLISHKAGVEADHYVRL